jgi:hypothetical protein
MSVKALLAEYTTMKRSTERNKQKELTAWLTSALAIDELPTDMASKKGFYVALVQAKFFFFCYRKSFFCGGGGGQHVISVSDPDSISLMDP